MFRKKLGDIKGLFLKALGIKQLSCTKNTELAQAISAKFSEQKGYYVENNRINQVLKEAGFAMSEPKKWHKMNNV